MRSALAALAVSSVAAWTTGSQGPAFRSGTDLVALQVTVTDANGRAVHGLTADGFQIFENDRPRPLEQFTQDTVPLNLVIDLDTSGSMVGARFAMARSAVTRLLERLKPTDHVSVLGFSSVPYEIVDWTSDRSGVEQALDRVQPHDDTALYDSVFESIRRLRTGEGPRKAVVVISDGNDENGSDFHIEDRLIRQRRAQSFVQRSEALVYAIGIAPGGTRALNAPALRDITDLSGAFTQIVRTQSEVEAAAVAIAEELRQQYLVGFIPESLDGKFHRVKVVVKDCPHCHVRARAGFVAIRSRDR
jgi:Ca-activated chloride channel family protein